MPVLYGKDIKNCLTEAQQSAIVELWDYTGAEPNGTPSCWNMLNASKSSIFSNFRKIQSAQFDIILCDSNTTVKYGKPYTYYQAVFIPKVCTEQPFCVTFGTSIFSIESTPAWFELPVLAYVYENLPYAN